jgi:DNA replication and repair protein RecF
VYIKSLELKNFRNYSHINLEFDKNSILFTGNNGNGKTNLLESIHYLSTGRSHRTYIQDELIKWGSEYALLRACIKSGDGSKIHLLEIEIRRNNNIKIRLDGVYQRKKTDFISLVPSVIFSPDDLKIIKSNPGKRRDFMDSILEKIFKDFYRLKLQYNKILLQRNSLLKSTGGVLGSNHTGTLEVWNQNLVKYGTDIMITRYNLLKSIGPEFSSYITGFFDDARPYIEYVFSWNRDGKNRNCSDSKLIFSKNRTDKVNKESISKIFMDRLKGNLDKDMANGTTTTGPHRDDFKVFFKNKDIRSFGSQGQQRISAISLKLCELYILKEVLKREPVLLLDDVLSELDIKRREKLVKTINKNSQTFITSTNRSHFDSLDIDFQKKYLIEGDEVKIIEWPG